METNWTFLLNAFLVLYLKNIKGIEITADKGTWCFPKVQHKNNPRRPRGKSVESSSQANADFWLGITLVNNEPDKYNIVRRDNSMSCTNTQKGLRRWCSPIGHNNTKHFLCPIRSQHSLDRGKTWCGKYIILSINLNISVRSWYLDCKVHKFFR